MTTNNNATEKISIRAGQSNILKIEVNDRGDCITLNFSDRGFLHRFYELGGNIEKWASERAAEMKNIGAPTDGSAFIGATKRTIEIDEEFHKKLASGINDVFGAGTCQKVFDCETPDVSAVCEFIEQITPIIQREADKRKDKVSAKYTAKRRGGKR